MGVLAAHQFHAVDGIGVCSVGEQRALDWGPLPTTSVPQYHLAAVRPPDHIVGMELAKGHGHHWALCVCGRWVGRGREGKDFLMVCMGEMLT